MKLKKKKVPEMDEEKRTGVDKKVEFEYLSKEEILQIN